MKAFLSGIILCVFLSSCYETSATLNARAWKSNSEYPSEKDFPEAEYQVMIADNWAAIKDKVLMQHLTKPVRIVVCGATEFNVHIDYLNLARKTNGSVHLMESDLYNLAGLKEGEILKVGKNTFVVKNGMFVETEYDLNNK